VKNETLNGRRDKGSGDNRFLGNYSSSMIRYVGLRLLIAIPQLIGVSFLTFLILRLLPADPALAILGPYATPEGIARVRSDLGLDQPLWWQFWKYITNAISGDLGTSWQTSKPVFQDLTRRFPATLQLIILALLISLTIGLTLGVKIVTNDNPIIKRFVSGYGLIAGALPEFWVGLILIELFFVRLALPGISPPVGQIALGLAEPTRITGALALDAFLSMNLSAFLSTLSHLLLPTLTLVIILVGPILKLTRASVEEALASDYIWYLRALGQTEKFVKSRALRTSLPSILTLTATNFSYLLGGAVLVETVFSWGGVGQYAVQAIQNADLMAIQGFVLLAGALTVLIYLALDIINAFIDPRLADLKG